MICGAGVSPGNCLERQHLGPPESEPAFDQGPQVVPRIDVWKRWPSTLLSSVHNFTFQLLPGRAFLGWFQFWKPEQMAYKRFGGRLEVSNISNCNPSIRFSFPDCYSDCSLDPVKWNQTRQVSSVAQLCGLLAGAMGHGVFIPRKSSP